MNDEVFQSGASAHGSRRARRVRAGVCAAAAFLVMGATGASPLHGQMPDRSQRPGVGPVPDLELPPVERFTLQNGLDVLVMEKRDLPLVQVNLHVRAGTVDDPADRLGLADLTADMLDEGAAGRGALELADELEYLGARFGVGAGTHLSTVSLRVPVARLDAALGLMADVIVRPDFPAAELDRLRQDRVTYLIRRHDEPNLIASALFQRTLYGADHPYGRGGVGTAETLAAITTDDLRAFHRAHYRPDNATLVVVGDVDAAGIRGRLEAVFGEWRANGEGAAPARVEPARQVQGRTVYLVDVPGAAQSVIQIGRIGVDRRSDDYYALQVMNTILGGSFTSRLNQNLREDKGYTYGARSSFDFSPVPGPFVAGAAVQTDATAPALVEFMKELEAIREPIPEEEVALARNFLAMRYPAGFQSVAGIAGRLADVIQYGLPADYFNEYTDRVLAVTREDVERVARRYIDPENVVIVIVGDRSAVEDEVRALGLGELRVLEVTDVLGPVPTE